MIERDIHAKEADETQSEFYACRHFLEYTVKTVSYRSGMLDIYVYALSLVANFKAGVRGYNLKI